jgi:hypothetical protein
MLVGELEGKKSLSRLTRGWKNNTLFIQEFLSLFKDAISIGKYSVDGKWLINMEQLVESKLTGKTETLKRPQKHYAHHKSHMTYTGVEPEPWLWEAGD